MYGQFPTHLEALGYCYVFDGEAPKGKSKRVCCFAPCYRMHLGIACVSFIVDPRCVDFNIHPGVRWSFLIHIEIAAYCTVLRRVVRRKGRCNGATFFMRRHLEIGHGAKALGSNGMWMSFHGQGTRWLAVSPIGLVGLLDQHLLHV